MDAQADEDVWSEACRAEYRQNFTITAPSGKVLTGKEALDLFKFLTTRGGKKKQKFVNKSEDYTPAVTKK